MQIKPWWVVVALLGVAGCGGDDGGEPLLSGSVVGSYDGDSFDVTTGFAAPFQGQFLVALGDGNLRCGSENANDPPSGMSAALAIPTAEVGVYSSVFVQLFDNTGSFEGVGSNTGSVELTAVTDASVSGSVTFDYTDDENRAFSLSGTFEVVNCPM